MTTLHEPRSGRRRPRDSDLALWLEPVAVALVGDATLRAEAEQAAAEQEAGQLVAEAALAADRTVAAAAAEGREVARRTASLTLSRARRQGRGLVLAARRRAFEEARRQAVVLLGERLRHTPEGRAMVGGLARAMAARVGVPVSEVRESVDGAFGLRAERGRRRVQIDAADLVDASMGALSDDVGHPWR